MPASDHRPGTTRERPPTAKQLAYLRRLADRSGTSFAVPATRYEASRQIAEMQRRPRYSRLDRDLDRQAVRGGDLPDR